MEGNELSQGIKLLLETQKHWRHIKDEMIIFLKEQTKETKEYTENLAKINSKLTLYQPKPIYKQASFILSVLALFIFFFFGYYALKYDKCVKYDTYEIGNCQINK